VRLRCAYAACEWVLTERVMGSKADIRARVLARRDGLAPEQRIEMSLAMAEAAEALSFDPGSSDRRIPADSVGTRSPAIAGASARARGARLCLPVVMDRETIVFRDFVRGGGSRQDTGFGTSGPGEEAEVLEPDLLLMPLSSFDARGNRLGYGAGHYDRAIARLQGQGKVATC
jgi:5-formyltetrahydrofolate cyclo-ligase